MNQRSILLTGAALGGLAVAIGAFGAHALKAKLAETGYADTYELAVRYQFYHALALLLTGLLMQNVPSKAFAYAGLLFLLGVIFFSGSLFVLSLSGLKVLGAVTPIGGLCFIAGWCLLLAGILKN